MTERLKAELGLSTIDKLRWRVADAWNSKAGEKFEEILDRVRPDVVHTHNIKGFSPILWHIARKRGVPVVHTGHSYEIICAEGSLLSRRGASCAPTSRCKTCRVHGAWYRARASAIDVMCSPSTYLLRAHEEAGVQLKRTALVRSTSVRATEPSTTVPCTWKRLVPNSARSRTASSAFLKNSDALPSALANSTPLQAIYTRQGLSKSHQAAQFPYVCVGFNNS